MNEPGGPHDQRAIVRRIEELRGVRADSSLSFHGDPSSDTQKLQNANGIGTPGDDSPPSHL
jgi:hypothetical protein